MSDVLTCVSSIIYTKPEPTGVCCARVQPPCPQPPAYAVLFPFADGEMIEHLRCVEHAAHDRLDPALLAMKTYTPPLRWQHIGWLNRLETTTRDHHPHAGAGRRRREHPAT